MLSCTAEEMPNCSRYQCRLEPSYANGVQGLPGHGSPCSEFPDSLLHAVIPKTNTIPDALMSFQTFSSFSKLFEFIKLLFDVGLAFKVSEANALTCKSSGQIKLPRDSLRLESHYGNVGILKPEILTWIPNLNHLFEFIHSSSCQCCIS